MLSMYRMVGSICCSPISSSIFRSHKTWVLACVTAMYLASVDDRATTIYFLEHQEISPNPRLKQFPEVDFLSSMLLP